MDESSYRFSPRHIEPKKWNLCSEPQYRWNKAYTMMMMMIFFEWVINDKTFPTLFQLIGNQLDGPFRKESIKTYISPSLCLVEVELILWSVVIMH